MGHLEKLIDRIIDRANINLRGRDFDVAPFARGIIPLDQFARFYAFYGLSLHHPVHFHFVNSSIAGSYFLGKCFVDHSVLYKSDIRGDELKSAGEVFKHGGVSVPLHDDEVIRIKDSFLIKNLVHSNSHDPERPEEFLIQNTVSMHYSNIHGSSVEGSFLAPFATVDLTSLHDCVVGKYAYVQTGELAHRTVEPGKICVRAPGAFEFEYCFPVDVLDRYITFEAGGSPGGILVEFVEARKRDFEKVFEMVRSRDDISVPPTTALSRYAVVKGDVHIDENVLVAQRAYVEDSWLGPRSNVQENCYIIQSRLEGRNVTAHGGKVIHACLGENIFVGFNAFLQGGRDCNLKIGRDSIVMPHTIIDLQEPLEIPPCHLVWGCIRNKTDLARHSVSLDRLCEVDGVVEIGDMRFKGSGSKFVGAFRKRIQSILEANGAFFDGQGRHGHAQKGRNIAFNIIQPYPQGSRQGICPTMDIRP
jgi:carbonic anhydrase/acetyltransferase-like protein (isoleucine patch superfamily)